MPLNLEPVTLPRRAILQWIAAMAWVALIAWWHRNVVMDDPWITFRYARYLVNGHGLVFNPGEYIEGYSNLLWLLLCTGSELLRIEPLGLTRLLNSVIIASIFALLIIGIPKKLYGDEWSTATRLPMAALLLAATPAFGIWSIGGLETIQHTALVLVYTLALACAHRSDSPMRDGIIAGFLAFLLILSRPEGAMFLAPMLLLLVIGPHRKALLISTTLAAILLAIYTLWRSWYFGGIVANTVSAKIGGNSLERIKIGLEYARSFIIGPGGILLFLAALTLWRTIFRRPMNFSAIYSPSTPLESLILAASMIVLLQGAFAVAVGGDWMPAHRFLVPGLGALSLLVALGIHHWGRHWKALLLLTVALGGVIEARRDSLLSWCRWEGKKLDAPIVKPLEDAGLYLRMNAPKNALVAGSEAGILPFISEHPFIDMVGLVDATIAQQPGAMHNKVHPDYILSRKPDYVVLTLVNFPDGIRAPWPTDAAIATHPDFSPNYSEVYRAERRLYGAGLAEHLGFLVLYQRNQPPPPPTP